MAQSAVDSPSRLSRGRSDSNTAARRRTRRGSNRSIDTSGRVSTTASSSSFARLYTNIGLHRVGEETTFVRGMVHVDDLFARGLRSVEPRAGTQCDFGDDEFAFIVFTHAADRLVIVIVDDESAFGGGR